MAILTIKSTFYGLKIFYIISWLFFSSTPMLAAIIRTIAKVICCVCADYHFFFLTFVTVGNCTVERNDYLKRRNYLEKNAALQELFPLILMSFLSQHYQFNKWAISVAYDFLLFHFLFVNITLAEIQLYQFTLSINVMFIIARVRSLLTEQTCAKLKKVKAVIIGNKYYDLQHWQKLLTLYFLYVC